MSKRPAAQKLEVLPLTVDNLRALVENKFGDRGRYLMLFEVGEGVGLGPTRRCDCIALGMWGNTQHDIMGFEFKCSRADWLRELRDVSKADPFLELCNSFTLVTSSTAIATLEEIPPTWGWLAVTPRGLWWQRHPQKRPAHELLDRKFAFRLIAGMHRLVAIEKSRIRSDALDEARAKVDEEIKRAREEALPRYKELQDLVAKFETDSGVKLSDWRLGNVGVLIRALVELYGTNWSGLHGKLDRHEKDLVELLNRVRAVRKELLPLEAATS